MGAGERAQSSALPVYRPNNSASAANSAGPNKKAGASSRSQGSLDIESTETKPASSLQGARLALLQLVAVLALLVLVRWAIPVSDGPAATAITILVYAMTAVFAALACRQSVSIQFIGAFRSASLAAGVFLFTAWLDPRVDVGLQQMLLSTLTVLMITCFCLILFDRVPTSTAVPLLAVLVLLPVWAAPAIEYFGNPIGATNFVIAASPLTAVSVALDFDYLRTEWFYANSALGSMRYAYPSFGTLCAVLFTGLAIALLADRVSVKRHTLNLKTRED